MKLSRCLLPLRVAFLFSFQTTDCPRSPANGRELTDNAAAINKAVLLHIHINQTSNSTIYKIKKKNNHKKEGSVSQEDGGRCQAGWRLRRVSPALTVLCSHFCPLGFLP